MGICASADESGDTNNTLTDNPTPTPAQVATEAAAKNNQQAPVKAQNAKSNPAMAALSAECRGGNSQISLNNFCDALDSNQFDNVACNEGFK